MLLHGISLISNLALVTHGVGIGGVGLTPCVTRAILEIKDIPCLHQVEEPAMTKKEVRSRALAVMRSMIDAEELQLNSASDEHTDDVLATWQKHWGKITICRDDVDLLAQAQPTFMGVKKTIQKKKMDSASKLKQMKKGVEEDVNNLGKLKKVTSDEMRVAVVRISALMDTFKGAEDGDSARVAIVKTLASLSDEQLRKMLMKLNTKAANKNAKMTTIATMLCGADMEVLELVRENIDMIQAVVKSTVTYAIERAGLDTGKMKMAVNAVSNQMVGARSSGSVAVIDVNSLILSLGGTTVDDSDEGM
jgi:hypothetical protein